MMWIKATILGAGFCAFVVGMLALIINSVVWILQGAEWIARWCIDWRDNWNKWEG